MVYRSVRHPQVAEDVCQEVWVKAFRELPKLADPQAFPAWLYRIAGRACVDAARHSRRLPPSAEIPEHRLSHSTDDPERSAIRREQVRLTWEAMATMPARQHVALYLREIERLPYREIARMLQTSETAVEMLLFRARRGFARAYEKLEVATKDRCLHARRSMAAIIDGEATPVQQKAIRAHADACRSCSGELAQMRRAATAYSALLPLPVPALLGERIFESIAGASGAGAAAPPTIAAKLFGFAAANGKVATIALAATTVTAAASVGAFNSPIIDEVRPDTPASLQAERSSDGFATEPLPAGESQPSTIAIADQQSLTVPQVEVSPVDQQIADINDPSQTVNELTAPVNSIIEQATTDLSGTVGTLITQVEAATGPLPTVPPLPIETPAVPTPPPLPTVPPLRTIPPLP
jgi:RNA polymerase sigma-70 factor (ECF subfamily)